MDIKKFIEDMSKFTDCEGQITRLSFSDSKRAAAGYIKDRMDEIGFDKVTLDLYGTICGHLEGQVKESILIGSHYDTVINAGKYDGIVGIAVGLGVADYYIRNGVKPYYSLDVLALNDEEGVRFNSGFLSSKVICGKDVSDYKEKGSDKPLQDFVKLDSPVIDLTGILKNALQYIEVHIEQGRILTDHANKIGIVDCIVGIKRASVSMTGCSGHAGSTPMNVRRDFLYSGPYLPTIATDLLAHYKSRQTHSSSALANGIFGFGHYPCLPTIYKYFNMSSIKTKCVIIFFLMQ